MNPMLVPYFTEQNGRNKKTSDIPTKLMEQGIIQLFGEVDETTSAFITGALLCCSTQFEEISLYINSPGGVCTDGFAIKDVIMNLKKKGVLVNTYGLGQCCSMGAYLLSCGTGKRYLTPSCRYMIHSVQSAMGYSAYPDAKVQFNETTRLQELMRDDLIKFSKGKLNKREVTKLMQRDSFMDAQQCINLGLADEILG